MDAVLLTEKTAAPAIVEMIQIIGVEATKAMCQAFGGINLIIATDDEMVATVIGQEAAKALREYWSGGTCYVPFRIFSQKARLAEFRRLRENGMTYQDIALKMRVSERHAYRMAARAGIPKLPRKGLNS